MWVKSESMSLRGHMKALFQGLTLFAWWSLSLFGAAGQLTWTRGWICTVLYVGGLFTCRAFVARLNPGLLDERQTAIRKDTKPFDKIFLRLLLAFTIAQPILAGLDAARFHWAPMPSWSVYPGVGLFVVSAAWITWVLVKNPHAESSVRIQRERDHTVVSSGPYRFVRHPMYVGLILLHVSIALVLGSMWTLILAGLFTILFLWRTALEDRTLRRELSGYEEYTQVTRYRLMPGIW
jgi:protein-S-isoprenylcysteine O-methyltransferase Ste14